MSLITLIANMGGVSNAELAQIEAAIPAVKQIVTDVDDIVNDIQSNGATIGSVITSVQDILSEWQKVSPAIIALLNTISGELSSGQLDRAEQAIKAERNNAKG